ncbi:hypothetical protein [Pontibacter indicus]|uniref:Uncharacterized protein n=1 Tax=Pontibacter indicus TaxID=1317125 RepID=A0A1R3WZA5_9BACT|nr:hypothetical protein [Pontibacter indicus]SIT83952.1 hypothetical protein SAMN05444128_1336 [Pontibacter indicus]
MNRNNAQNDRSRKNHYADFDEHGNARTGNTHSLSRYNPDDMNSSDGRYHSGSHRSHENRYSDDRDRYERNRRTSDARAYGDFSGGTRYGEGGSTYGGGSAYGPSNYGMSGRERPSHMGGDRNYYDHNEHSRQNYSGSGENDYRGRMNDDDERRYRGTGYRDSNQSRSGYRNEDRGERGYNRSFDEYRDTGYGSTRYNNRDEDRERSAYNNWGHSQQRRSEDERRYNERNIYRDHQDW